MKEIRQIKMDSEEYQSELALRHELLRLPLGLSIYEEDLSDEVNQVHIGYFLDSILIGCLVLKPVIDGELKAMESVQIRQVAIEDKQQGKGFGTEMIGKSEQIAKALGYNKTMLHSRLHAIDFYKRLGYKPLGTVFEEVGIDHIEMEKKL